MDSVDFDALEERAREQMSPAAFAFCAAGELVRAMQLCGTASLNDITSDLLAPN